MWGGHPGSSRTRIGLPALRRAVLTAALAGALMLVSAGAALAAGAPVNIGTPFSSGPPSVAVDAAGDAVVAWANTKDLSPVTVDIVQYCVLPVAATGCVHSGNLTPAGNASHIDGVQTLVDGSTIVILADVFGAASPGFEPVQEWQSTDGGATFTQPNGGQSVTNGNQSADTVPLNGVIMPGANTLGFGWETAGSDPPTFNAFPLTSPPVCSEAPSGCPAGFAKLEPPTNPDTVGNGGGQVAAESGTSPGVLGVYSTDNTNGPFGCSNSQTVPFGTAFAFGTGNQVAGSNDYNISPGTAGSAWQTALTQGDCNVEFYAVAGGPSGFGVLEDNDLTGMTVYHAFDPATQRFDTPMVTVSTKGEQDPAISQDDAGGVYATDLSTGGGGPVVVAYSFNGGKTWSGPNTLNANSDQGINHVTSMVGGTGQGWAAWLDNGSVFAQSFTAADSVLPPTPVTIATSQTAGTTFGSSITIPAGTIAETDRATIAGANAASATGTMTYTLYSKPSCTAANAVFHGGTVAVTAGADSPSFGVPIALPEGKYYWQAVYSGNAGTIFGTVGNDPASSACGSEVLNVVPAATIGANATSNGQELTMSVSCTSVPCSGKLTLSVTEKLAAKANLAGVARKKKAKTKTITIGSGKFTIKTKGSKKLKVGLSKAGKSFVAGQHGSIKVKAIVSEKIHGRTELVTRTIKVKISQPKKHHKK
jgi:hypothetical protein